jgi:predicted ATP-dependent Lon-type protease
MIDENFDSLELMHQKLRDNFAGKIVRKDLTKKIKEGANVPVYVLEYLLGMYCSSQDEDEISAGVETSNGSLRIISPGLTRLKKFCPCCGSVAVIRSLTRLLST